MLIVYNVNKEFSWVSIPVKVILIGLVVQLSLSSLFNEIHKEPIDHFLELGVIVLEPGVLFRQRLVVLPEAPDRSLFLKASQLLKVSDSFWVNARC